MAIDSYDLECPICLEVFKEPVCIDCGHVFCKNCIIDFQNSSPKNQNYLSCPCCKRKFKKKRPEYLKKCIPLASITEKIKPKNSFDFKFDLDIESLSADELRILFSPANN